MPLGKPPQPTADWRPYIFRVHCLVTQRWMKIRVPFAWYWYGDTEFGTPEVEAGTIASPGAPQAPASMGPRMPVGMPAPLDAGQLHEAELQNLRSLAERGPLG